MFRHIESTRHGTVDVVRILERRLGGGAPLDDLRAEIGQVVGAHRGIHLLLDLGNVESEAVEYTSQGLCDQIPAEERHHYPYCSDAVPELSREIVDMIRMLGSGQNKVAIDRALAVHPEARTHTVAQLREELGLGTLPVGDPYTTRPLPSCQRPSSRATTRSL
jgi:hypothetical protein